MILANARMQKVWCTVLPVVSALVMVSTGAWAARHIEATPDKYLRGQVETEVATALKRGTDEHRPVWVVAWDKAFFNSPAAQDDNTANFSLHYFYENPETKTLVAQNFVQAFTTLGPQPLGGRRSRGGEKARSLKANLANYKNVKSRVNAARAFALNYWAGRGTGLHAAHALDPASLMNPSFWWPKLLCVAAIPMLES
jgi:hypothetical protein